MKKHLIKFCICIIVIAAVFSPVYILADEMQDENTIVNQELQTESQSTESGQVSALSVLYYTKIAKSDGTFTKVGTYSSYDEAVAAMNLSSDSNMVVTRSNKTYNGGVIAMKDGIAVSAPSGSTLLIYRPGTSTKYTYIPSGHTLFYYSNHSESRVTVAISGYKGDANNSQLVLIPRIQVGGKQSYYYVDSDGDIIHKYTRVSKDLKTTKYYSYTYYKAPSFLKTSTKYYSLDGKTFYKDSKLKTKVGTLSNYYNILPVRSKTKYSTDQLNYYISLLDEDDSVLNGQAKAFINAQNKYGVNAAIMLCIARLESANGTSNFATQRYNLFGLNAGDANPNNASYYTSVASCVNVFAGDWISDGYCDANGDFRYFGANLGNKREGINVYYASDPYWGQKIAGLYYKMDRKLGYKDRYAYNIGVTTTADYVYYNTSAKSVMYRLSMKNYSYPTTIPVIILDAANTTYYKIQSDMPMNDNTGLTDCYALYDYANDVGYVKKSSIKIIEPSTLIDRTYLEELVSSVESLDTTGYTEQSAAAFNDAYKAAVYVLESVSTTQAKINTAYNNLKTAYESLKVYVAVTGITLDKTSVTVNENLNPIQLTATISPDGASEKGVTWSSSDKSIATVSSLGLITPHKNGTVTITAKSKDPNVDFSAACTVTISLTMAASNVYNMDYTNGFIHNVMPSTDMAAFLNNVVLPEGYTAGVYSGSSRVSSGIIKTGMILKTSNGSGDDKNYSISVKGDLNGDGLVTISDLIYLKSHLLGISKLTAVLEMSGDLNDDSSVSISDFVTIKSILLGK